VDQGGVRCPFCGSEALAPCYPEAFGGVVLAPVECKSCRKWWEEQYDLAAIYELDEEGYPIVEEAVGSE
jgi:hypothetical protein